MNGATTEPWDRKTRNPSRIRKARSGTSHHLRRSLKKSQNSLRMDSLLILDPSHAEGRFDSIDVKTAFQGRSLRKKADGGANSSDRAGGTRDRTAVKSSFNIDRIK